MVIESPRRPGRPPKAKPPPPPRPRRAPGTGSIVVNGQRVYALDVRDTAGHREPYEPAPEIGDVEARYRDAERWISDRMAARKRLAGLAPETVRDYLDRWLWRKYRTAPVSTLRTRRAQIQHAAPISNVLVTDLTLAGVDLVTDTMVAAELSARYIRIVRETLRSAFADLVPRILATNPAGAYAGRLTIPKRRPNVWDALDAADFEREALQASRGLLWVLAVRYGVRGGELRALQRADLDPRSRELTVRHGMRPGRRMGDTKNHRERTITLVPALMAGLVRNHEGGPSDWLFAKDGQALTPQRLTAEFKAIVAAVNARRHAAALDAGRTEIQAQQTSLPSLTPHGLRHTAATLMLRGSETRRAVPVVKVSQILGHSKVSITWDMYGWSIPSDDDVVDEAIGSLMTPLPTPAATVAGVSAE